MQICNTVHRPKNSYGTTKWIPKTMVLLKKSSSQQFRSSSKQQFSTTPKSVKGIFPAEVNKVRLRV